MGGPMSCPITETHRRYARAALTGMEACLQGWPQALQIPNTPERQKFREVLAAAQEVLKPEE